MKKIINKYLKLSLVIISLLSLSSCWDYKEVEKRGYVLGIAIDKAFPIPRGYEDKESYLSEKELEIMELQVGKPKYAFTIQIPVLPKSQIKPSGVGSGGSEESRAWDLTVLGKSFFEANREFATRLDYPPFYEHLQVVVINEEVAREGIIPPLDIILRDPEMRRRTKVFITSEEAHKILDVTPRIDDYASLYLAQLPQNADKTSRMPHITDLGEVAESLHSNNDFVLPRVISTKDEIKDAGVAVFKKDKMVGWLGEVYTIYAKWIRDAVKGGIVVIKAPRNPDVIVSLELKKVKTKVRPIVENDDIKMYIESKATVNITELSETRAHDVLEEEFIKEVEEAAEKEIKKRIQDTIRYVQKELGADIFHFNVTLKSFEPKVWEEVKDNWDYVFKYIETVVDIKVEIKHTGTIK